MAVSYGSNDGVIKYLCPDLVHGVTAREIANFMRIANSDVE